MSNSVSNPVSNSVQPLLILSDAITSSTGLARIARDLAIRIHSSPALSARYRVATLGVGGSISTSSRFPFPNYSIRQLDNMIPYDLPGVWEDFAGRVGDDRQPDSPDDLRDRSGSSRRGVLLAIWNCSWTGWLARPETLPAGHPLRDFLLQRPPSLSLADWSALSVSSPAMTARMAQRPFSRWLYCPVDGHCPDGTLGWQMADTLAGMDRVLAYTAYGAGVIERTLEKWGRVTTPGLDGPSLPIPSVPALPHGTDTTTFHPRPRALARETMISILSNGSRSVPLMPDQLLIGVVATNTSRKDWALAFATVAELVARGRNAFLWGHTDRLEGPGHWNLVGLVKQFGLDRRVMLTTERITDDKLAQCFSACDVGLHIGAGEGYGYFGPQAIACGLPVVHGDYAGGVEFVTQASLVKPTGFYSEGQYFIQRPTFNAADWADRVEYLLEHREEGLGDVAERLDWERIWPAWKCWLCEEGGRC